MTAEAIILAATLSATLIGTGAVLYARMVKIETICRQYGQSISRLFKRTDRVRQTAWRMRTLEKRVSRLEDGDRTIEGFAAATAHRGTPER